MYLDVHIDHMLPLRLLAVLEVREMHDSSVVDKDVHRPESFLMD